MNHDKRRMPPGRAPASSHPAPNAPPADEPGVLVLTEAWVEPDTTPTLPPAQVTPHTWDEPPTDPHATAWASQPTEAAPAQAPLQSPAAYAVTMASSPSIPARHTPAPQHSTRSASAVVARSASAVVARSASAVVARSASAIVARTQPQRADAARPHFAPEGYELVKLLGRGGMGEVYLANRRTSAGVSVPCVIKTIIERADAPPDIHNIFLDEARICALLRHPNVVSIMDVGRDHDRLFMALEWIEGIDGANLLDLSVQRKKGLPLKHSLYIIREALKGLHHAHTAVGPDGAPLNIIHRDISPGNLLISRQGAVKLADFGVALGRAAQSATGQTMRAGKPAYTAPEIWQDQPASVQSDLYAMGVTLYELLTCRPLFPYIPDLRVMGLHIAMFDPSTLIGDNLTLPEGIEDILLRALAPQPQDRYASALEFLEDVNDFTYEVGLRLLDVHFARFIERMLDYRNAHDPNTP